MTQHEEFIIAAKPLMDFLKKNYNPHVTAIVCSQDAEVVEGLDMVLRSEFITIDDINESD